jgi:hypothetical protein
MDDLRAVGAHSSITYNDSPFVEWGDYLRPIHMLANYKTVKNISNYYLHPNTMSSISYHSQQISLRSEGVYLHPELNVLAGWYCTSHQ